MGDPVAVGLDRLSTFFRAIYGERWPKLLKSLREPVDHVAVLNQCLSEADLSDIRSQYQAHPIFSQCLVNSDLFPQPPLVKGLSAYYLMDAGSLIAPLSLQVGPDHSVLDICAAPGGKSLLLAYALQNGKGTLTSNDMSVARRQRLQRVLQDYLPSTLMKRVKVSGIDATRNVSGQYDRILVDAPCSSERHVLADPGELSTWSSTRTKTAAERQLLILTNAARALKAGGRLVYATCSISPDENGGVVQKAQKRIPALRSVDPSTVACLAEMGEPTSDGGWIVLPDRTGYGPLYIHILERRPLGADTDSEESSDEEAHSTT